MIRESERGDCGIRRMEEEQKKGESDEQWNRMRESETRDKVLLKCCFRLMGHLPDVTETLFGSRF